MLQLFNILSDKRSRSHVRDYRDWDNGYVPDIGILLIHSAEEIYAGFRDRDEPEGCFRKTKAGLDIRIVDIVQITSIRVLEGILGRENPGFISLKYVIPFFQVENRCHRGSISG